MIRGNGFFKKWMVLVTIVLVLSAIYSFLAWNDANEQMGIQLSMAKECHEDFYSDRDRFACDPGIEGSAISQQMNRSQEALKSRDQSVAFTLQVFGVGVFSLILGWLLRS